VPGGGQKGLAGLVGVGGQGRGVSDGVRALMGKRRDWIEMVGPVVGFGRPPIPGDGETVFSDQAVEVWESVEREAEMGEGEGGVKFVLPGGLRCFARERDGFEDLKMRAGPPPVKGLWGTNS